MFWLAEVFNGSYSADELQRREQWARRARAQAVHQIIVGTGRGLARVYHKYRRWQRRRAAIRELSGLSDQILQDIGLVRDDIRTVVDEMLDGKPESPAAYGVSKSPGSSSLPGSESSGDRRDSDKDWQRAA